jgi:hypothetical protein
VRPARVVLLSAVAVLVPVGLLSAAASASAAGAPKLPGSVTCSLAGAFTFTPALTSGGTSGYKNETIQLNLTPTNCVGSMESPPGTPSTTLHPTHVKDTVVNGVKLAGACGNGFTPVFQQHSKWFWGSGYETKIEWAPFANAIPMNGEVGFTSLAKSRDSYRGAAGIYVYFNPADIANANAVCVPGGTGAVTQLGFDSTTSSVVIGVSKVTQP